jgi:hypothetical protein
MLILQLLHNEKRGASEGLWITNSVHFDLPDTMGDMSDNNISTVPIHVRNSSEQEDEKTQELQNRSEETVKTFRTASEAFGTVPNGYAEPTVAVPNRSEETPENGALLYQDVRNDSEETLVEPTRSSEPFRTVPNEHTVPATPVRNGSEEKVVDLPKSSESFRTVEVSHQEQGEFRTAPVCSEQHEACTITVREAARIFEEAGAPRTERAITNWCNRNSRGVTRLDACYHEGERKYFITPESIERVVVEERKKMQYLDYREGHQISVDAENLSEQVRKERSEGAEEKVEKVSEPRHETPVPHEHVQRHEAEPETRATPKERGEEQPPEKEEQRRNLTDTELAQLKELRMENYELRVQLEGQKYLVRQFDALVEGERDRHEREKLALVDRLTDARHQIGSLEQKLLQIEAPKQAVRDMEMTDTASRPVEREQVWQERQPPSSPS